MCASLLALAVFLPAAAAHAELFGKQETPYTDLRPFPKWTGVLERYFEEKGKVGGSCASREFNSCHYNVWKTFTESVRNLPQDRQLEEVNRFFNDHPYITDPINWGVADYWETPGQFFTKNGDCEDYAIAKYMTLRNLGWPMEKMRVVILQDMNLELVHAILAVDFNGRTNILDNQIAIVVDAKRIKHYRPVYAVNEEGWWRFH